MFSTITQCKNRARVRDPTAFCRWCNSARTRSRSSATAASSGGRRKAWPKRIATARVSDGRELGPAQWRIVRHVRLRESLDLRGGGQQRMHAAPEGIGVAALDGGGSFGIGSQREAALQLELASSRRRRGSEVYI